MRSWTVSLALVFWIGLACVVQVESGGHKPNKSKKNQYDDYYDDDEHHADQGHGDGHWVEDQKFWGKGEEEFKLLDWFDEVMDAGDDWLQTDGKEWWEEQIEKSHRLMWATKNDHDKWLKELKKEFAKLHEEQHRKHHGHNHHHDNKGRNGKMHGHNHDKHDGHDSGRILIVVGIIIAVFLLALAIVSICRKKLASRQQVSAPNSPYAVSGEAPSPTKIQTYLSPDDHTYANAGDLNRGADGIVKPPAYMISDGVPPPVYTVGPYANDMDTVAPNAPPSYSTIDVQEAAKTDKEEKKPKA